MPSASSSVRARAPSPAPATFRPSRPAPGRCDTGQRHPATEMAQRVPIVSLPESVAAPSGLPESVRCASLVAVPWAVPIRAPVRTARHADALNFPLVFSAAAWRHRQAHRQSRGQRSVAALLVLPVRRHRPSPASRMRPHLAERGRPGSLEAAEASIWYGSAVLQPVHGGQRRLADATGLAGAPPAQPTSALGSAAARTVTASRTSSSLGWWLRSASFAMKSLDDASSSAICRSPAARGSAMQASESAGGAGIPSASSPSRAAAPSDAAQALRVIGSSSGDVGIDRKPPLLAHFRLTTGAHRSQSADRSLSGSTAPPAPSGQPLATRGGREMDGSDSLAGSATAHVAGASSPRAAPQPPGAAMDVVPSVTLEARVGTQAPPSLAGSTESAGAEQHDSPPRPSARGSNSVARASDPSAAKFTAAGSGASARAVSWPHDEAGPVPPSDSPEGPSGGSRTEPGGSNGASMFSNGGEISLGGTCGFANADEASRDAAAGQFNLARFRPPLAAAPPERARFPLNRMSLYDAPVFVPPRIADPRSWRPDARRRGLGYQHGCAAPRPVCRPQSPTG